MEIPVYLFTGFLEAGKTKFIQETLENADFDTGENTLVIVCEEGIEEFKRREDEVLSSLNFENHIIATGGRAVYSENGMIFTL